MTLVLLSPTCTNEGIANICAKIFTHAGYRYSANATVPPHYSPLPSTHQGLEKRLVGCHRHEC